MTWAQSRNCHLELPNMVIYRSTLAVPSGTGGMNVETSINPSFLGVHLGASVWTHTGCGCRCLRVASDQNPFGAVLIIQSRGIAERGEISLNELFAYILVIKRGNGKSTIFRDSHGFSENYCNTYRIVNCHVWVLEGNPVAPHSIQAFDEEILPTSLSCFSGKCWW